MIVLIGMICGIVDLAAMIAIFGVNACMILFGLLMEKYEQPGKPNWLPVLLRLLRRGSSPGSPCSSTCGAPASAHRTRPAFVYGIIVSLFVFFNIFAVNMVLQYKKVGPWKDYLYGEKVYIILSLTAKALLAWQVFASVLAGSTPGK